MHLVLIGNTGSGKSTLADALGERLSLPVISSGKIARRISDLDPSTDLALKQGAMAPEATMRAMVRDEIEAADALSGGWVLDGFPRTVAQVVCLTQWVPTVMPTFFHLVVSEWTCVERLAQRERHDDNPDSIAKKLEHWRQHTVPMLALLHSGHMVIDVDGERKADAVLERTLARVDRVYNP
jgi:adenylate kinase